MAINFKFLFQQTGKLVLYYIVELRGLYWRFSGGNSFLAKILPGTFIKMVKKGDIAEIAYKSKVLLKYGKSFEYSTLKVFKDKVMPGDIIIDVGANVGLYSVFFSELTGNTGKILAFEPDSQTGELLYKNLQLNGCNNVEVLNIALSDKEEYVQMQAHTPEIFKANEGDAFKYMKQVIGGHAHSMPNAIKALRMDDIKEVIGLPKIDYIKIDVEGAELLVLKGAVETIKKHKPVIIFELSGKYAKRFNYQPYEVLCFLNALDYEMEEFDLEQWLAKPLGTQQ